MNTIRTIAVLAGIALAATACGSTGSSSSNTPTVTVPRETRSEAIGACEVSGWHTDVCDLSLLGAGVSAADRNTMTGGKTQDEAGVKYVVAP